MSKPLTAIAVANVRASDARREIHDGGCGGLYLVVHPTGSKSWVVRFRVKGVSRKLTLGPVLIGAVQPAGVDPELDTPLSLAAARELATKALRQAKGGTDPTVEKKLQRRQVGGTKLPEGMCIEQYVAHKALAFLEQNIMPACYLYRHYHPTGDLLYVGISLVPLRRQDEHLTKATWRDMICRILIEPFATREEALAAEKIAIRTEFPKFNSMHNGQRHPFQELARPITLNGGAPR